MVNIETTESDIPSVLLKFAAQQKIQKKEVAVTKWYKLTLIDREKMRTKDLSLVVFLWAICF